MSPGPKLPQLPAPHMPVRLVKKTILPEGSVKISGFSIIALGSAAGLSLVGCSMKEEIKRIEARQQAQMASDASRSANLTGEQIYIRSCNTCHPSGRKG